MNRLKLFRVALISGASAFALTHPARGGEFNIPRGDLSAALEAYTQQAGVEIIYSDDAVRGRRSPGAKGNLTETAALTEVLRGTGLTAQTTSSNAIGIVPESKLAPEEVTTTRILKVAAATPAGNGGSIETVVVTAQKKSENIQQVPIAITALTQQQLTDRQIAGGPDLVHSVPNVTFNKTNFTGYNLEVRGIGTQAISVTTDPAVAVAFNDVPFIRNHFFEQEFFDVDNVEVLRGPQGTLYGRNATAGVFNLVSARPTDHYEAMLSADVGNYDSRRFEAMLNLPIVGDQLDIRFAGEWTKRDGYTDDSTTGTSVDGRDLWSGRMTIGWKPRSDVQTYFIWEHFSEDDDRLRSGKQLCKTDPGVSVIDGVNVDITSGGQAGAAQFSQGCAMTSLYSPQAYEVVNGKSLPYYEALNLLGNWVNGGRDPYASSTQSTNLRSIESSILPTYKAKNDTLEFNANWNVTPTLTFTSQTGYNHDFLWSTEDYNRFNSSPGLFNPGSGDNILGQVSPTGVFCDPQLGCSNKLEAEDLSEERAWQLSQEFRLSSNFSGPLNFSVGGNFLHYETVENYYVFINSITLVSSYDIIGGFPLPPWNPRTSDNSQCLNQTINPSPFANNLPRRGAALGCVFIDDNPIGSLNNEGHNYFLSQNPYVLNSYAGFGEVYYNPFKDLKLTAGARWTDDRKHFLDIPSWIAASGIGYPVTGTIDQGWNEWTGRFAADWTPQLDFTDQTLLYASFAHGYKAGGANPPGAMLIVSGGLEPTHPLTFKPEHIEAFELGTKNTLLGDSLTLNGDVFYYNYTGYQISQIVDRTAVNLNFNAHVEGAELETNWEPVPGLKFGFTGGYEATGLASGNQAIDLMDRTAGRPDWYVTKPFYTYASNCVLPGYVIAAVGGNVDNESPIGTGTNVYDGYCAAAYSGHLDPVTGLPYTPYPFTGGVPTPGAYPGFNPATAPNNGAGFYKNLSGNQLPNAPHFTTSLMAEYTMPVSDDWAATLHTDFSWQSQQWARVFADPIDKLHGYSNVNLSLILTNATGWQVMAYVKNVFNTPANSGTFLNSDDTGLTSNVFLNDPRLFGVRVTKHLDDGDGFWGSDYSGKDFFTGLFSDTDNGKPPLWIELGGNFDVLENGHQILDPAFVGTIPSYLPSPLPPQKRPGTGFDWEGRVSYQPEQSDWIVTAAIRYGRTASDQNSRQITNPPPAYIHFGTRSLYVGNLVGPRYVNTKTDNSESHLIIDFLAGKDVGLGSMGDAATSVINGGIRAVAFSSVSRAHIMSDPDETFSTTALWFHHNFDASQVSKRSFHGIGPTVSWDASSPVSGSEGDGEIAVDWGANVGILFGRRKAEGSHATSGTFKCRPGFRAPTGVACHFKTSDPVPTRYGGYSTSYQRAGTFNRSRMVAVPNLGGFVGLSMKYHNAKVSFGYRADEFFGAMDGGIDTGKSENMGFFGPYANISIGLGG